MYRMTPRKLHDLAPGPTAGLGRYLLAAAALILCAAQLVVTLPGQLRQDSVEQLRQAMVHQYGDWHPPVMALVWSWLIDLTGRPGSLLVMQQALHWLGFGLTADGCLRARMPKRAWLILAAGAFPLFLFFDREVLKDVEMGSAFVAAFGLCARFLLLRRPIPAWALAAATLLLCYGTLCRTNAVFALGPLVCVMFSAGRSFGVVKVVAMSAVVAVVALVASNVVNHQLIGAKPQDAMQSLQLYDLVGVAVRSGDASVLGPAAPALSNIRPCYTEYAWDPLSPWGSCAALRDSFDYIANEEPVSPELMAERIHLWREAIIRHPLDYARHRLAHYNSSLYFIVPALQVRLAGALINPDPVTQRDIRLDYLRKPFLFWPVVWLALGGAGLVFLAPRPQAPPTVVLARLALMSGLLYGAGYLLVGVGTDMRYYYWTSMSILVGLLLAVPDMRERWRERPATAMAAAALVMAVIVAGYAARFLDIRLS